MAPSDSLTCLPVILVEMPETGVRHLPEAQNDMMTAEAKQKAKPFLA